MLKSLSALVRKSKQWLYPYYLNFAGGTHLTLVPINKVYCQELPFSVLQGFGGKPISFFPPCQFFQMALNEPTEGYDTFYEWLRMCLLDMEAWRVPKAEGGWADGSLVRNVYQLHKERGIVLQDFAEAKPELVHEAIDSRTRHYFGVFESIRQQGFKESIFPPITCRLTEQCYILQNGHHRSAALYALGHESVLIKTIKS